MNSSALLLFWSATALIIYIFAGYPLLLAVWAALKPHGWRKETWYPNVSIVIAAHNEAGSIVGKIQNLLSVDYPEEQVEILVGSDGSTDETVEQLLAFSNPRVHVFIFPHRQGKPAVLNALIPKSKSEIVVLADARQTFDRQALTSLIRPFADAQVGAVTGELVLPGAATGSYWEYEKFVRSQESVIGSTVVVTGAIYAIRRSLFEPIPHDTIVDDLLIPLRIARRGYRVIFERSARAYETAAAAHQEFRRKVRTLSGAFRLLAHERWLLNPLRNRLWLQFLSHKALRLLVAPLQMIVLVANVPLASVGPAYALTLTLQLLFYLSAIAGWILPQHWKKRLPFKVPFQFCLLSWATVWAFSRWITRRETVIWEKLARSY